MTAVQFTYDSIGRTFRKEGTVWLVAAVTTERSEQGFYQWEKVVVRWSGIGPMPTYATESRTFIYNRRQVTDFLGKPLEQPRYIN
jgi:hypothetical protein